MSSASPICLMARASSTKSWLWHQRLSHLNFDTINESARNDLVSGLPKFKYNKEHLCPSLKRRNRTLVEAARTMLIFSRAPLFLWAEAIATVCFTQNRSIIHHRFNKTQYELINGRKPDISFLHVFGDLCYPKNDREDIGKLGAKGDIDTAPTPTNSSSHTTNIPNTSQNVAELNSQQQRVQQQGNQAHLQSTTVADNVPNALFDGNTFVNPFAIPSTSDSCFELTGFSDADYAGCKDTFKSTSGGAQFLGEKLVSWSSKKQDCTALSSAKAEYVSLSACCVQVLWMRTQLMDYGFHFNKIPIYCNSKSAIAISCNPVQHSRTKHIAVRYHFIKEHVEKGMIELYFVKTDYQLADLFTKALPANRFNYLVRLLGMRSLSPHELDRLAKSQ
nr:retrovirus-related Pol polyprotein from transposon TNT 1-94 [Tanacetum cinerariifolium]